jgi:hypothetical protein
MFETEDLSVNNRGALNPTWYGDGEHSLPDASPTELGLEGLANVSAGAACSGKPFQTVGLGLRKSAGSDHAGVIY